LNLSKMTIANTQIRHVIRTGDHNPISFRPYSKTIQQQQILVEHIQQMEKNYLIRRSTSPWASPVVLIKKKDESTRFCVDYRKLNNITKKDSYPLPHMGETINRLGGHQYFTKLDLKSGYFQIPIQEDDKEKTAFILQDGHWEFNVLPQGLKNAPPTFQRIMNELLAYQRWDHCLVYLDDIIIFSKSFQQHVQHLDEILTVLNNANFQLNPSKCSLIHPQMDYLGHTVNSEGITPLMDKVKALIDLPTPKSIKDVDAFLGAAKPLLLSFPDPSSPLVLSTDASDIGYGGVLEQITKDGPKPISYLSRKLNPAEKRYGTIEKECLTMVRCIEEFRSYLLGREYTVETDHCPLCNFHKKPSKNGRVDRWSIGLGEYDIVEIKYKKGKCNCDADLVSRYPATTSNDQITSRNVRGRMNGALTDDEEEANPQVNVITRPAAKAITNNNNNKTIALAGNHTKSPKSAQTMTPHLSTTAMQLRPRNKIINLKTSNSIPSTSLPPISKVSTATPSTDFDITKLKMEQQQDTVILDKIKEIKQDPTTLSYEVVDGLL
ncbi:unnamed protein product, partial [Didymodactylos carnosus]